MWSQSAWQYLFLMVFFLPHCVSWVTGLAERSSTQKERKKIPLAVLFSVAVNQLWSQELIDLFPLKIHQVEWDWRQSLGSVNMGPRWPASIWTAPQVQWSERCVLWPRVPWKGLRLGPSAWAKPPTHPRICASLCQDHGPATCQPLQLNSCLGCPMASINQSLHQVPHSVTENPSCKCFIFLD